MCYALMINFTNKVSKACFTLKRSLTQSMNAFYYGEHVYLPHFSGLRVRNEIILENPMRCDVETDRGFEVAGCKEKLHAIDF